MTMTMSEAARGEAATAVLRLLPGGPDPHRIVSVGALLQFHLDRLGMYSTGEKALMDVAFDLWNGGGEHGLFHNLACLDGVCRAVVVDAVMQLLGA